MVASNRGITHENHGKTELWDKLHRAQVSPGPATTVETGMSEVPGDNLETRKTTQVAESNRMVGSNTGTTKKKGTFTSVTASAVGKEKHHPLPFFIREPSQLVEGKTCLQRCFFTYHLQMGL